MHPKVEQQLDLDVRALARAGLLAPGASGTWSWRYYPGGATASIGLRAERKAVILSFIIGQGSSREQVNQRIDLTRTRPYFGGSRPWWCCPGCGRRVAILYGGRRFLCRACHGLAYTSQSEGETDRILRRARKLRNRMGVGPGVGTPLSRPRGMHWRTYASMFMEVRALEDLAMSALMGKWAVTRISG